MICAFGVSSKPRNSHNYAQFPHRASHIVGCCCSSTVLVATTVGRENYAKLGKPVSFFGNMRSRSDHHLVTSTIGGRAYL